VTTAVARVGGRVTRSLRAPGITESAGAARIRRAIGVVFGACGLFMSIEAVAQGAIPAWPHMVMLMMAAALISGRGGTFVRDWVPVILGFMLYVEASQVAERLHMGIHYMPQIDIDRAIGFGTVPTQWLQAHLYHGHTGPLEVAALVAYASHFFVPLGIAFYIWWARGRERFMTHMFSLLVVSVLAEVTYVLAPTAPPWLAAQSGHLPHVHEILKQALADLHMTAAASAKGDPHAYNIVAAVPSLHVAWPIAGLLAIRAFRLPRWVLVVQLVQLVAVVLAIVYTGEHYVFDALAGGLYAVVSWRLVQRVLRMSDLVEIGQSASGGSRIPGWMRAVRPLRNLAADDGQALVEYAAITGLVSIAAFAVLSVIGGIVNVDLSQIAGAF
jgi:Flp pilus assembly pilin Flp